jgi:hypothetical protein
VQTLLILNGSWKVKMSTKISINFLLSVSNYQF